MQSGPYEYDVALSFAGENRDYVDEVASFLRSRDVHVFYDEFEQSRLWGQDLYEYLHDIYYRKARFCVMFLSAHYARKRWTAHERRAAQERAFLEDNEPYILPARFDDTVIPGVRATLGYLDLTKLSPIELGKEILRKIGRLGATDDTTRESWESYGWLFDVDGYRVAYIPLLNDWGTRYVEKGLADVDITVDDERYELSKAFCPAAISTTQFADKPSCRLDFYSLSDLGRLVVRFKETSYGDYLRSGEHLDDPIPGEPERTYRDEFGKLSRERSGDLRLFPLTNICGVGLFVVTRDKYLVATTHSEKSHVYPGRKTFSASGTVRWGAFPDPFAEVMRKADHELNHLVDLRNLRLVGFGADARKLYFQFSFLEKTRSSMREIKERCAAPGSLFSIPFSLEQVREALLEHCWEPAAEVALLTLCAQEFGRNEVADTLAARKRHWGAREMRDEWDYRAARPGLLPDMSVRYPAERLKEGSDQYLDQAFHFVGSMAGKKVLEVGSGTGRFTERLLTTASEVTCVELSDRMIAHMKARISDAHLDASRLKIVSGLAQEHLPLRGKEVVICSLVLIHNVREPDFDVLVKGMCESADTLFVFEDVTPERKTSPHTRLRSENDLLKAFAKHRFLPVRREHHALFADLIVFLELQRSLNLPKRV